MEKEAKQAKQQGGESGEGKTDQKSDDDMVSKLILRNLKLLLKKKLI